MWFKQASHRHSTIAIVIFISALCDSWVFGAENYEVNGRKNNRNNLISPRFLLTNLVVTNNKNYQRLDTEDNVQSGLYMFENNQKQDKIFLANWMKTLSKRGKSRVARQTSTGYSSLYPHLPASQQPHSQYPPYNTNPYQPGQNSYGQNPQYNPIQGPPYNNQYPGYNPAHSSNPPYNPSYPNPNGQYPSNPPYGQTTQRLPYGVTYPSYNPTQRTPYNSPSSQYPSTNHSQGYYPSQNPTTQRSPYGPPNGQYPAYNPSNSGNWQSQTSSYPNSPYNTTPHSQYPSNPSYPSHIPTGQRPPYNQPPSQFPAYNSRPSHSVGTLASNYTNPHGKY